MFLILHLFYHQDIARTAIAQGAVAEPIAPTPIHPRTISHPLAEAKYLTHITHVIL